jgi:uncharacterized membrane protein
MIRTSKLVMLSFIIVILAVTAPAVGTNGNDFYVPLNESEIYFNQLILDIYVDETGRALVTGYVENIEGLPFIQTAEYLYENDTQQLYALTNALTWKYGDTWTLNFTTAAYYTDYHTIFYLPADVRLGRINSPAGLDYLVSASNDSFVVDMQGYDIDSPSVTIEYQQPVTETGGADTGSGNDNGGGNGYSLGYLPLVIALFAISVALIIAVFKLKRREEDTTRHHAEEPPAKEGGIEKTPEMARIMETLTERERAIVNALIKHNGEMTQVDLRYETEIPKSSLTGILRTLERRQIIKKKEWGRTNVIELSDWFLSKKKGE